jgi:hypothetical protein
MGIMIRITGSPTKITDLTFVVATDLLKSLHLVKKTMGLWKR